MKNAILLPIVVIIMVFLSTNIFSQEKEPVKETPAPIPVKESPALPKITPQFFCGHCHILTYPKVMQKAYNAWKTSKHKGVACGKCHYPPEVDLKIPEHDKIPTKAEEAPFVMKGREPGVEYMKTEIEALSRVLTILNMEDPIVLRRSRIDDSSCTSTCHPKTGEGKGGEYFSKEINLVESEMEDKSNRVIRFVHETHLDGMEDNIEGLQMHCGTCHQRESGEKHFEVSKEKCFLCHFINAELSEDRADCSICHEIPTKSLQNKKPEPGAKLITHQTIMKDDVPCNSCHYDVTNGNGVIKEDNCLECHDNSDDILENISEMEVLHTIHVTEQRANCFDCHEPIKHRKGDFLEAARMDCSVCHPDHHEYEKVLLTGAEMEGVSATPALMQSVRTGCLGCHVDKRVVKGEIVMQGDSMTCARCHVEKTAGQVKQWKENIDKALEEAKGLEGEVKAVIEKAKGKASDEKLKEAMTLFDKGQQGMLIVEAGGGVHNQKYAIQILDVTFGYFENAMDMLKEEE